MPAPEASIHSRNPRGPGGRPPRLAVSLGLATLLLCLNAEAVAAQKTDLIALDNGNQVIGEVMSISRGTLTYKTDHMGTLSVKWEHVVWIDTDKQFQIETRDGRLLLGDLRPTGENGMVQIGSDTLPLIEVVVATRIKGTFVSRTAGYFDLGFTAAQANSTATYTLGAEARYRGLRYSTRITGNSYFQTIEGDENSAARNDLSMELNRFVSGRYSGVFTASAANNRELSLDLRLSAGLGGNYRLQRSQRVDWTAGSTQVLTDETFSGEDTRNNLELNIGTAFAAFRLDSPKLDTSIRLNTFTGITDRGRFRLELEARASYEVMKDFYLGASLKDSSDNKPGTEGASKNDYTFSFTVGWSWG